MGVISDRWAEVKCDDNCAWYGICYDDTLAKMANAGIKGSLAGTDLKKEIIKLCEYFNVN